MNMAFCIVFELLPMEKYIYRGHGGRSKQENGLNSGTKDGDSTLNALMYVFLGQETGGCAPGDSFPVYASRLLLTWEI